MITANYAGGGTPRLRILVRRAVSRAYAGFARVPRAHRGGGRQRGGARVAPGGRAPRSTGRAVRIPAYIIRDAIASTPPAFTVWGRGEQPMRVANDRVHFGPGLTSTYFVDPETGERRPSRRGDPALTARVADALPNIDYVMGLGLIGDGDRASWPRSTSSPSCLPTPESPSSRGRTSRRTSRRCTGWPLAVAGGDERTLRGRPVFALFSTYPSPLRHTNEDLGNVMWAARHDMPVGLSRRADRRHRVAVQRRVCARAPPGRGVQRAGRDPACRSGARRPRSAACPRRWTCARPGRRTARPSRRCTARPRQTWRATSGCRSWAPRARRRASCSTRRPGSRQRIQVLMSALERRVARSRRRVPRLRGHRLAARCWCWSTRSSAWSSGSMRGIEVSRDTIMLDLIEQGRPWRPLPRGAGVRARSRRGSVDADRARPQPARALGEGRLERTPRSASTTSCGKSCEAPAARR